MDAGVIAREKALLLAAPKVTPGPQVDRCHFCGQPERAANLTLVETLGTKDAPIPRYKGRCCNGK